VHAIQLELAQLTYMQEEYPYSFDESRAAALRPVLTQMLREVLRWARG
jgi:N-formylglutamate deformylase